MVSAPQKVKNAKRNQRAPLALLHQQSSCKREGSPSLSFYTMPITLTDVDNYEVPDILTDRVVRLHGVPREFALGILREAKRMLYLSILTDTAVAPSGRVDWAWHEMLMFTRYYRDFCAFIGGFVHHDPNPPRGKDTEETWESIQATLGKPRAETETYTKTKALYRENFGEAPDPLYWP